MIELLLAASLAVQGAEPRDCQAAIGSLYDGPEESALPNPVDGASLAGARALAALRAERGDAVITVRDGDFAGADFRGARLHNICFIDTRLAGADFRGALAPGIGFVRADLSGADLRDAHMRRIALRQPNLANARATGADFSGGRLDGGWDGSLAGVNLDAASLRGFRFECGITLGDGCPLERSISLRGADLTGAFLHDLGGGAVQWRDARLDRTEIGLDQVAELVGAEVAGPIVIRGGDATTSLTAAELAELARHIVPDQAEVASFDCGRATSAVERAICGEYAGDIRALDRELAGLYRHALARDPGIAPAQRDWLRSRDRCADEGEPAIYCLRASYERRRAQLVAALGPPDWLRPGAVAYFVAPPVRLGETFRGTPLYERLLPVLVGASWSDVVVRANRDGSIDAAGEAVGANAHSCSLGGRALTFDPETGWFSGPAAPADDDPPLWRGRPMAVLLLWDERAQVFQDGRPAFDGEEGDPRYSDYASCGARAAFSEMIRVPIAPADAVRLLDELSDP